MTKAVIYARQSTEKQEASIERQLSELRTHAERSNIEIVGEYIDRAITGEVMEQRPQIMQLIHRDARAGTFNMILADCLDRLSRDKVDLGIIFRTTEFLDITVYTLQDGVCTDDHATMRGWMGKKELENIAYRVRTAHKTKIREHGTWAGKPPYGYRFVAGAPKGTLEPDPCTSPVVIRIYEMYRDGIPPRAIALTLSKEGVPGPDGGRWNRTTISGGGTRRFCILTNPIYVGKLVRGLNRNKRTDIKGRKKVKRPGKPEDLVEKDAPHLRIISPELKAAVDKIQAGRSLHAYGSSGRRKTPFISRSEHLLSGLVVCGVCHGPMRVRSKSAGAPYVSCTAAERLGTCKHLRTYNLDRLQIKVRENAREELTNSDAIKRGVREHNAEYAKQQKESQKEAATVARELDRNTAEQARIAAAIGRSKRVMPALEAELERLEDERMGLLKRQEVVGAETNVVKVVTHPKAEEAYLRAIDIFTQDPDTVPGRQAFRNIVAGIVVKPLDGEEAARGQRRGYKFSLLFRWTALIGMDPVPAAGRSVKEILEYQGINTLRYRQTLEHGPADVASLITLGPWTVAA